MIIRGRFVGGAPYVSAHLRSTHFHGLVSLLVDTGASRTTLLDRDVRLLGIPAAALVPSSQPVVGVGGCVQSSCARDVEVTLASDAGDLVLRLDVWVVQHDLQAMPSAEAARVLRLPSLLGRDVINQFLLRCDYQQEIVELSRP